MLVLTQPQIIQGIHEAYLEAGADIIETNTFNSTRVFNVGLPIWRIWFPRLTVKHRIWPKKPAAKYSTPEKPPLVAGVIRPTSRTTSISPNVNDPAFRNITFDALKVDYLSPPRP